MVDPTQTTVVFVPGGWHSPECFRAVGQLLEDAGYATEYVHLPSVGPEKQPCSLEDDVARVRSHIVPAVEAGRDVVVVVHSYGGVPSQDAVQGLDKASRSRAGQTGGVCQLFFCCALIVDEGQSASSAFGDAFPPWSHLSEDGTVVVPDTPEDTFYQDLDPAQAKAAAAQLKPHSALTGQGLVQYAAWKHVPSTYLYCLKDQALPYEFQKTMVEQVVGGAGIQFRTESLDAGHSPFLVMPVETSQAIRRAAGEQV